MRPRHVLGAATAALLLAACQASASPAASPSLVEAASSEAASSGSAIPSFVGAADLEATLPTIAAGIPLQSFSMSGPDFIAGEEDEQFLAFIESLGADVEDVSVALAFGANAEGTQTASVFAFQVSGASAPELIEAFKASAEQGLTWHPATMGGKSVEVSETTPDFATPVALYATGDVLYFVSSTDPDAMAGILAFLP
ncbi:MAG: hypothetical protein ACRDFZ_00940 [Candidatus Limnocylindria bacterium]